MRVLAIVCVRNEAVHVVRCLNDLIASGCEVVLIDNGSTDGTMHLAEPFLGRGLIEIRALPWTGTFSLSAQLKAKRAVIEGATCDWIVHADADEWLVSPVPGQSLVEAITAADQAGCNIINFREVVFIPLAGEDHYGPEYTWTMRHYYLFEPHYPRLQRAWRRDAILDNVIGAGHRVSGEAIRQSPVDLILRHYIVLSQEHGHAKYLGRRFDGEEVGRGWHNNRVIIDARNIRLRTHPAMRFLPDPMAHDRIELSQPLTTHYWQWPMPADSA